jgi:hypothetical protein
MPEHNVPLLDDSGLPFMAGDAFPVTRTVTDIPAGRTLTKGYLTIKNAKTDADPGVLQKAVTTTNVPGTGQIIDDGAADGTGIVRFEVTKENSAALGANRTRFYDIKLFLDNGDPSTLQDGPVKLRQGVTAVSS